MANRVVPVYGGPLGSAAYPTNVRNQIKTGMALCAMPVSLPEN